MSAMSFFAVGVEIFITILTKRFTVTRMDLPKSPCMTHRLFSHKTNWASPSLRKSLPWVRLAPTFRQSKKKKLGKLFTVSGRLITDDEIDLGQVYLGYKQGAPLGTRLFIRMNMET